MFKWVLAMGIGLLLAACQSHDKLDLPVIEPVITPYTFEEASQNWPIIASLAPPQGLRACCAFGYNLQAELWGLPVPFYTIDNIVEADSLGEHHYNDSF